MKVTILTNKSIMHNNSKHKDETIFHLYVKYNIMLIYVSKPRGLKQVFIVINYLKEHY